MYSSKEFLSLLEGFAPLYLSRKMIENGSYDNSGLIVKNHDNIKKILFALDLTEDAVNEAKNHGCDTVVTHHPVIYSPINSLGTSNETQAVLSAIKEGLNLYSMHLNLDIAEGGIDQCLTDGLGGETLRVLERVDGECGYGRISKVKECEIEDFVEKIIKEFGSDKIIRYGSGKVELIASFCGAGASSAVSALGELDGVDTVVTSDIAHHHLLSLITAGKKVVVIPHFVAENYGFNKFYQKVAKVLDGTEGYYFTDKRFM